ncbi:hypothetical protein K0M31_013400 [Melipona bicolor]|uniref:Uncharacterized protein n=1 Tax=Melipona bicolor TaxID=60889 RepID=A0AA40FIL9_9HYME|nr:hypothetical protein K0M31_013400 [Melipona bicolor]
MYHKLNENKLEEVWLVLDDVSLRNDTISSNKADTLLFLPPCQTPLKSFFRKLNSLLITLLQPSPTPDRLSQLLHEPVHKTSPNSDR